MRSIENKSERASEREREREMIERYIWMSNCLDLFSFSFFFRRFPSELRRRFVSREENMKKNSEDLRAKPIQVKKKFNDRQF